MRRSIGWNPWRALRERPHIELVWAPLEDCEARIEDRSTGRRIVMDPAMSQVDRNAHLVHELIHDERGIFYPPATPPALVEKEEYAVRKETALRMLPMEDLIRFVEATQEFVPITAEVVAERFSVPVPVAREAMRWVPAF